MNPILRVLLFAALLAGCDLFSTRDPEPPTTGSTFIWTPATSSEVLLSNFVGTVNYVDPSNHARVFLQPTDSVAGTLRTYQFFPRPGIDQTTRAIFDAWTYISEQNYMSALRRSLPQNVRLDLKLTDQKVDKPNSSSATVTADYTLALPVEGSSVLPKEISGSLQLELQLVTTQELTKEWRIVAWYDFAKSPGATTWTDLKVKLSS